MVNKDHLSSHSPNVLREYLPEDLEGVRILDAGCGRGDASRFLARQGALVSGVDISEPLIRRARQDAVAESLTIDYRVHDLTQPLPFEDQFFDAVVSVMTLMDVHDPLAAIRHIGRTIRMEGILTFSILHPCFYRPKMERYPGTGVDTDHYYNRERIEGRHVEDDGERFFYRQYHRTLGDYLMTLVHAQLFLETFVEGFRAGRILVISARKHAWPSTQHASQ